MSIKQCNNLLNKIQSLPSSSGVYQYFDKNNRLLYVGKAKNLKNRVKSYFKFTPTLSPANRLSNRITNMVSQIDNLEYIVVPNEHDALILENSLIKQLKPKYNILLRDDKTYPYIFVDFSQDFPRLEITRKVISNKNIKYFGPFSQGAKEILDSIYDIVPLVQKSNLSSNNKACLFYQIKKCLAPCEDKISKTEYKVFVEQAIEYITNKKLLIDKLQEMMQQLASKLRFEEAKKIRDRIKVIEKSQIDTNMDLTNLEDIDIFGIEQNSNKIVIVKMFIKDGKIISSSYDILRLNDSDEVDFDEVYKRAIINFYTKDIPMISKNIIVAHDISNIAELEEFLKDRFAKNIKIIYPKRGRKKELKEIVLNNCKEILRVESKRDDEQILYDIKELYNLQTIPYRIEIFDNSHLFAQAIVGAMVVYEDNRWQKSSYRRYNLSQLNEYAQMKEMLTKRVESFDKNPAPNLWVIDGGKALLDLAYDIVCSVGLDNIDIIAISKEKIDAKAYRAKGKARDIIYTKDDKFRLDPSDKRLQFIQKLRDEAHRFAITFHQNQKRKLDKQISLLSIKGFGEAKVKKLLNYFGTFENIYKASIEDLNVVLNKNDSLRLYEYIRNLLISNIN
jgi:excinuclease ABC subunit C